MNSSEFTSVSNSSPVAPISGRWAEISSVRQDLGAELDRLASTETGAGRRHLQSLSRWCRSSAKTEAGCLRVDVLAVFLAMVDGETESISSADVRRAAAVGLDSTERFESFSRSLVALMLYPLLVLLGVGILGVAFCCFIAPMFAELFLEFGIELPLTTKWLLHFTELVRQGWYFGAAFLISAGVVFWVFNRMGRARRPGNLSWLDLKFMSRNSAVAMWTWHVSLMLEAGFSHRESVDGATKSIGKSRFPRIGVGGDVDALDDSKRVVEAELVPGENSNRGAILRSRFFGIRFELLNHAIDLPNTPGKIALLKQVAANYWGRSLRVNAWVVQWSTSIILWGIGFMIFFCVWALFAPLFSILSGFAAFSPLGGN